MLFQWSRHGDYKSSCYNYFTILAFSGFCVIACSTLVFCSKPTSSTDSPINEDPSIPLMVFTDSTYLFDRVVDQYSLGDSVYVVAREFDQDNVIRVLPPVYPVWIYSENLGDVELLYLSGDVLPYGTTYTMRVVGWVFLPITQSWSDRFNGVVEVAAGGDSLTAFYFSTTPRKIVSVGARIEE